MNPEPEARAAAPREPLLVVAALAESRDGPGGSRRIFLARRSPTERHGGLWELPGGKVEAGEEPAAALLRELREELGLEAEILGPPQEYSARLGGKAFRFLVFPTAFPSDPVFLAVHDAFLWAEAADIQGLALAPLDGPALETWLSG